MPNPTDEQKAKADAEAKALEVKQAQEAQEAAARKAAAEAARPLDQTVPGGRYVVNGVTVDASGKEIKE